MQAGMRSSGTSPPRAESQEARHVSCQESSSGEAPSGAMHSSHSVKAHGWSASAPRGKTRRGGAKAIVSAPAAPRSTSQRPAAASANDPRQWILALSQPSSSAESATPCAPPPQPSTTAGTGEEEGKSHERTQKEERPDAGHEEPPTAAVPLEERIGMQELQLIMLAFCHASHAERAAAAVAAVNVAATGPEMTTAATAPARKVPDLLSRDAQAVMGVTPTFAVDGPPPAVPPRAAHTSALVVPPVGESVNGIEAPPPVVPSSSAAPLRTLSRCELISVLQQAVPSATQPEIQALLAKAISDTQDTVSWNELATFLVTCSQQKTDLAMEDRRFVLAGRPYDLHFKEQHGESITCVAVNRQRRLIVTGCSGGAVRAWSDGSDLTYRGLLLKVKGWIVGLHWGCRGRVLYVVTMDRSLYVLEGTTYEVLRVFHGRNIKGTAASVAYASETIDTVHIGGVALPKHRSANERGYAGARLRMPSASPSSGSGGKPRSSSSSNSSGRASMETVENRMNRLLSSAMQVRRGVQPTAGEESGEVAAVPAAAAATTTAVGVYENLVTTPGHDPAAATPTPTATASAATLTTGYSLTTAGAAEALHQDSTPLTGAGRGPYVMQHVEEGVLASLVDAVSATAFEESVFQEDVLLLGTSKGDAFLFVVACQCDVTQLRVLVARHVFVQLHRRRITKLAFSHVMNALLSAGEDGRVRVTSLVSGQSVRTFYAPELPEQHTSVTDFALHPQLKMLLTIGPERRALVWGWNQPTPIAVLETVNRPLCCGAFMGEQLLTVSRDRVLHVYDCKSFRLRQELPLGSAGSLTRFGGAKAAASSCAPASSSAASSASSWTLSQLHVDPARQRVLGFGHFPFALCVKRQVSSGCPARYRGHRAPTLAILTSRAFGQVVTVGKDGVVMTWTPRTGVNEFSFLLSNFSNAAATTGAPMAPIAASMDVLQRRLLTGFAGGVVVAWNVLNGQAERVLTASTFATAATAGRVSNAAAASGGGGSTTTDPLATYAGTAATATASSAPKRGVTAVGSFLRGRAVSYLFAVGRVLYVDADPASSGGSGSSGASASPQVGEYTTTYPSSWTPQSVYGDVITLLQISPQNVACGTTSGAVLIYNVLSDSQEGAPLWVREAMLYPPSSGAAAGLPLSPGCTWRSGGTMTAQGLVASRGRIVASRHGANSGGAEEGPVRLGASTGGGGDAAAAGFAPSQSPPHHRGSTTTTTTKTTAAEETGVAGLVQRGHVMARTIRLLTLPTVHPRLLVMAQEDGTVSMWHTLRRVCIGAVNLTSVGLGEEEEEEGRDGESRGGRNSGSGGGDGVLADAQARGDGPAGTFLFDMEDEEGRLLVFGDGEGNVHVCRLEWQVLSTLAEQVAVMSMPNALLYPPAAPTPCHSNSPLTPSVRTHSPPRPHAQQEGWQMEECERREEESAAAAPSTPAAPSVPDFTEAQRSIPLLRRLERVHVFSSGLVLTGLRIVDAAAATTLVPAATATAITAAATTTTKTAGRERSLARAVGDVNGSRAGSARPPRELPCATLPFENSAAAAAEAVAATTKTTAPTTSTPHRPLVIICTGADHYVRAFTLAGVPIGELGMDEWDAGDPRTYRFMGEAMGEPALPLPCSVAGHYSWQSATKATVEASPCYFNYIADLHALHLPHGGLVGAGSRNSARHGGVSIAPATLRRSVAPIALAGLAEKAAHVGLTADTVGATPTKDRWGLSPSPERRSTAAVPSHGSPVNVDVVVIPHPPLASECESAVHVATPPGGRGEECETAHWTSWQAAAPPNPGAPRCLSTRLHRSTRYRHTAASRRSPGVVRRPYIAVTPLAGRRLSLANTAVTAGPAAAGTAVLENGAFAAPAHALPTPIADSDLQWRERALSASSFWSEQQPLSPSPHPQCHHHRKQLQKHNTSAASTQLLFFSVSAVTEPPHMAPEVAALVRRDSRRASCDLSVLQSSSHRVDSASGYRCNSASTRVPRSGRSTLEKSHTMLEEEETPLFAPGLASPLSHDDTVLSADRQPQQPTPRRRPLSGCPRSLPATTSTSSGQQPLGVFPSIPPAAAAASVVSDRPSPVALAVSQRRDKCGTVVSPVIQRGVSRRTPSMTASTPCKDFSESLEAVRTDEGTGAIALLAREHQRLMRNTRTPAARDQLSALAMPTISPPQSAGSSRSPHKGATASTKTLFTAFNGTVQQHVDSLLERRRRAHQGSSVGDVSPEAEMRTSAVGFVAHMTSQLYVAPLLEPQSPELLGKPCETSLSLSQMQRSRTHLCRTL